MARTRSIAGTAAASIAPRPLEEIPDAVDEASLESFPASDAPPWPAVRLGAPERADVLPLAAPVESGLSRAQQPVASGLTSLHDFFDHYVRGQSVALVHDDGLRRWTYSYDWLREAATRFAVQLAQAGLRPGDRLAIRSESRPEWVAAFWGCILQGIVVIPIDPRASSALAQRLLAAGTPRALLVSDSVPPLEHPPALIVWRIGDIEWSRAAPPRAAEIALAEPPRASVGSATVAEIVFTSGTTGEPKGVLITHGNILANIAAIEPEARQYNPYLWPFRPLRFLELLPLSHMFGQALTMFLPPLVRAASVFISGYNPDEIVTQIRRHRITLVVTVPRVLEMLRDRVRVRIPGCGSPAPVERPIPMRLWRYRAAHRLFWWRFCGFVVGGAPLEPGLEDFWRRLGFVVVQGYGLTETAPMAAWNHPFRLKPGTVGKPLANVDIRVAPDGEILVRGPIVTPGYLNAPAETRAAIADGWLHTGDLGSFDESGHLLIRGRKKEMIATPEGLKVFPEDVERVLDATEGVREAAVVARRVDGREQVHAVLVLQPHAQPADVIAAANAKLEPYQRLRGFSVWPGAALPRTEAIGKLKHGEIRAWVEGGATAGERVPTAGDPLDRLLAHYAPGRRLGPETSFDELGITSLDRLELVTSLEDETKTALSESLLSGVRTVGELRRLLDQAALEALPPEPTRFPTWNRTPVVKWLRAVSQATWLLPPTRMYIHLRVEGREHLAGLEGPAIFAPNHQSHFDVPAVLRAFPRRWRQRVAVPMWKEFFDAHFHPERHTFRERTINSALYHLLAFFFNGFPLPQTEPSVRDTLKFIGELVSDGYSILLFPEGERTDHGEIKRFQQGVGLMASKLRLPVVPVRLEGVDRVLHRTWRWPKAGPVRVTFGAPLTLVGADYASLARRVEEAVRELGMPPPVAASAARTA